MVIRDLNEDCLEKFVGLLCDGPLHCVDVKFNNRNQDVKNLRGDVDLFE